MTQLHAQPYDLSASGFYFESFEEFTEKSSNHRNMFGQSVEEYQIQFIDGEAIDCALAESVGINQVNIQKFIEISDLWSEDDKLRYVLAVGECGYAFDLDSDDPNELDVDIYHMDSMRELAQEFVDQGIMGDIPEALAMYFDLDALACDLAVDYSQTTVAGQSIIYRCS